MTPLREIATAIVLFGWAVPLVAAVSFLLGASDPDILNAFPYHAAARSAIAVSEWWLAISAVAVVVRAVRRPRGRGPATGRPRTDDSGR